MLICKGKTCNCRSLCVRYVLGRLSLHIPTLFNTWIPSCNNYELKRTIKAKNK